MLEQTVPFIGRSDELNNIHTLVNEWGTQKIIFISGEGGVGKTRLLQEVENRINRWKLSFDCKLLSIIDFDDDQYKLPQNSGFSIAQQLGYEIFGPYLEQSRELQIAEERAALEGISVPSRKMLTVNHVFIECFAKASAKQRIIIRVDTVDALKETGTLSYLLEMAGQLSNTLFLIAGRNVEEVYKDFENKFPPDTEHKIIKLEPFNFGEFQDYLMEKQSQLGTILDTEWAQRLFLLANGVPVLIDLAIEWAANHRKIDIIDKFSVSELLKISQNKDKNKELELLQKHFLEAIIMPIADLNTKQDQLKFLLAKIYPLDSMDIQELLNLSKDEVQQTLVEAKKSVSIKILPDGRIKLHDEVQRLIEEYIWPSLDPTQSWEKRDSERAINHLHRKAKIFLSELEQAKEEETKYRSSTDPSKALEYFRKTRVLKNNYWSILLEILPKQLALDVFKGYEQFLNFFDIARKEIGDSNSRFALLAIIGDYGKLINPKTDLSSNFLSEQARLQISRLYAREMTHNGMYNEAAIIYDQLLTRLPPNTEDYLDALRDRASQLVRAGKIRQAEVEIENGLQKAIELKLPLQIIKFHIDRGWTHRLVGNLDQAINNYNIALRYAFELNLKERIALIFSQRAYVLALQHKHRQALTEIQQSIEYWKELRQDREEYEFRIGQAWNIAGEIYLEAERPEDAVACFERSLSIFEREEGIGTEWRSKARSGRGYAYWLHGTNLIKSDEISVAKQYFDYSHIDLSWAYENASDFDSPAILNRLGEVYFALKKIPEVHSSWQEALALARDTGDAFSELNCLGNLARLAFFTSVQNFPHIEDFEHYYRRNFRLRYPTVQFTILEGLLYTYLGHLALKLFEIDKAINLYQRGIPLLTQSSTYAFFNLQGQLSFIDNEIIPNLPPQLTQSFGKNLSAWLLENHSADISIALAYFQRWTTEVDSNEVGDE